MINKHQDYICYLFSVFALGFQGVETLKGRGSTIKHHCLENGHVPNLSIVYNVFGAFESLLNIKSHFNTLPPHPPEKNANFTMNYSVLVFHKILYSIILKVTFFTQLYNHWSRFRKRILKSICFLSKYRLKIFRVDALSIYVILNRFLMGSQGE